MVQHVDGEPEEEYESIPWESILRDGGDDRRSRMLVGGGLVLAAVVVGIGSRVLFPPAGPEIVEVPLPRPPSTSVPAPPPTTAPTSLPSEADLMAVLPPDLSVAAATTAEWFLADYFTLDGSGRRLDRWEGVPPLAAPDPGWRSAVLSVEAVETRTLGTGRHLVTVRVERLVTADPEEPGVEEAAAYDVLVGIADDGMRILDLPRPADVADVTGDVPAEVLEGAIDALGPEAAVSRSPIAAERRGDRWRIVLGVADGAGVVWPLAVWVDEAGDPVPAAGRGSAEVAL